MEHGTDNDIATVTTTVGSVDQARALAREMVERRLAACVQLDLINASIYRWEGAVQEEPEVRLSIKTIPGRLEALRALFAQHHPYDLPQFLVITQWASDAYAQWVRSEVEVEGEGAGP